MKYSFSLGFMLITCLFFACKSKQQADTLVYNAHIFTLNEKQDTATVMVIKDGEILAIGSDTLLEQYTVNEKIDAQGEFIYPGFNDAHCHFSGYAMDKYKLALFGTRSFDEIVERILVYSKANQREWIEGRGWDQNDWNVKMFPNKEILDSLFPNRPIYLVRIDGHAALCNQKALDIAGITEKTIIEGGECLKQNGKLTGLLIDNAMELVKRKIPQRTESEILSDLKQAEKDCFSLGLTSVTDCGISAEVYRLLASAYEKKALTIRNSIMLSADSTNRQLYLKARLPQTPSFHVIGYKLYADGALGSRGAALLNHYHDRHGHSGLELISRDSIKKWAEEVKQTDYQLCTHAIGDRANRIVLSIYAEVLKEKNDRRWRIEHAQIVAPEDRHFFGEYNIIPSVQPTHATSDMYWAEERLGAERMPSAYAYKSLLQENHLIPLGTDFPVEEINPLATFCSAVFRQNKEALPEQGFQKQEALSRHEALMGMTFWAAYAAKEENLKGSLEPGKKADWVILPINLYHADLKTIYQTKISATYIDGRLVYKK